MLITDKKTLKRIDPVKRIRYKIGEPYNISGITDVLKKFKQSKTTKSISRIGNKIIYESQEKIAKKKAAKEWEKKGMTRYLKLLALAEKEIREWNKFRNELLNKMLIKK